MTAGRVIHAADVWLAAVGTRTPWLGGWRGPSALAVVDGTVEYLGPSTERPTVGAVLPGFTDSHVHLGLVDPAALYAGGIARVVDLGWTPDAAAGWLRDSGRPGFPEIRVAGGLLTAPGGYPVRSSWAPPGAALEIDSADAAARTVAAMSALGATVAKLTLNTEAGPVFDDDLLAATVAAAHEARLPVVVHAEGPGQAMRAALAGADALAHTPWSERLSDDALAAMAERHCEWTSTLDIHGWGEPTPEFAVAQDNLRRFVALGGRVRYGTDQGNGPLPVGLDVRELEALAGAGLSPEQLVWSLVGDPGLRRLGARVSVIDAERPAEASAFPRWLASARVVTAAELTAATAAGVPGTKAAAAADPSETAAEPAAAEASE